MNKLNQTLCMVCAPLVLVIVTCMQFYNAHFRNLTPWEAGGFGMFSTVDNLGNRFLRCHLITDRGDFPVEVPSSMQHLSVKVRSIPSPELLTDFARQLAGMTWLTQSHNGILETSHDIDISRQDYEIIAESDYEQGSFGKGMPETVNIKNVVGVRVEVWRPVLDSQNHSLASEQITAVTANRELD